MKDHPRIWIDPERCGGAPCIRGTRVRVIDILEQLAGGCSRAEIIECYPGIEDTDITAALEFSVAVLKEATPGLKREVQLSELLDEVTTENKHTENSTGPDQGKEHLDD